MDKKKRIVIPIIATAAALAILAGSGWAQATSITTISRSVATGTQTAPCLGDVQLTFVDNIVTHMTTDASGGVHIDVHDNISDFDGVILASGIHINSSQTWQISINSRGPGPYQGTVTETLTGSIPGEGLVVTFTIRNHITIDANGRTTVERESYDIECR